MTLLSRSVKSSTPNGTDLLGTRTNRSLHASLRVAGSVEPYEGSTTSIQQRPSSSFFAAKLTRESLPRFPRAAAVRRDYRLASVLPRRVRHYLAQRPIQAKPHHVPGSASRLLVDHRSHSSTSLVCNMTFDSRGFLKFAPMRKSPGPSPGFAHPTRCMQIGILFAKPLSGCRG